MVENKLDVLVYKSKRTKQEDKQITCMTIAFRNELGAITEKEIGLD